MTAKEWKDKNPNLDGNMRDYANILQLVILINLENLNAEMINQGITQNKRKEKRRTTSIYIAVFEVVSLFIDYLSVISNFPTYLPNILIDVLLS